MFCFKCGKQIRDDAIFCQYCGTNLSSNGNVNASHGSFLGDHNKSPEIDRKALTLYLENVLFLEYANNHYAKQQSKINKFLSQKPNNSYYKKHHICRRLKKRDDSIVTYFVDYYAHFLFDQNTVYVACLKDDYYGTTIYTKEKLPYSFTWINFTETFNYDFFNNIQRWSDCYNSSAGFFEKKKQRTEARDNFLRAYNEFKQEGQEIYQKNYSYTQNERRSLQQKRDELIKEHRQITALLEEAYSVNIIPSNFRHELTSIYYLYDFVSTSRESFSTALLHFNLDEIKKRLETIVLQNQEMIIQNQIIMAQNEVLINQNHQSLEQLSKISDNSEQAVQYMKISTNYAKTCAWIESARYLREIIEA